MKEYIYTHAHTYTPVTHSHICYIASCQLRLILIAVEIYFESEFQCIPAFGLPPLSCHCSIPFTYKNVQRDKATEACSAPLAAFPPTRCSSLGVKLSRCCTSSNLRFLSPGDRAPASVWGNLNSHLFFLSLLVWDISAWMPHSYLKPSVFKSVLHSFPVSVNDPTV